GRAPRRARGAVAGHPTHARRRRYLPPSGPRRTDAGRRPHPAGGGAGISDCSCGRDLMSSPLPAAAPERVVGYGPGATVLVLAPHPDDETLGAGGTIARLTAAGAAVHVLAVACPDGSMWGGHSDPAVRVKEFQAACDILGVAERTVACTGDG